MRKIVAGLFISLDGVVESPEQWMGPYFTPELGQVIGSLMGAQDAMLLGRVTYEMFAAHWPHQTGEMADTMNGTPKFVVSGTLKSADWQNSTLIPAASAFAEIAELKQQPGQNIGMTGSGTLVSSLLREGLLDELHLFVFPLVAGLRQAAVRRARRQAAAEAPRLRDVQERRRASHLRQGVRCGPPLPHLVAQVDGSFAPDGLDAVQVHLVSVE